MARDAKLPLTATATAPARVSSWPRTLLCRWRGHQALLARLVILPFGGSSYGTLQRASRQDTVNDSTLEAELLASRRPAAEGLSLNRPPGFCDTPFRLQTVRLVLNNAERLATRLRLLDMQDLGRWRRTASGPLAADLCTCGRSSQEPPCQKFQHFRARLNLADIAFSFSLQSVRT